MPVRHSEGHQQKCVRNIQIGVNNQNTFLLKKNRTVKVCTVSIWRPNSMYAYTILYCAGQLNVLLRAMYTGKGTKPSAHHLPSNSHASLNYQSIRSDCDIWLAIWESGDSEDNRPHRMLLAEWYNTDCTCPCRRDHQKEEKKLST